MAEVRDLEKALAQRPPDAVSGEARRGFTSMQKVLDASGLSESVRRASQTLASFSLDEITKSADKATKALGQGATMSYLREAGDSLRAAQSVLGKIDLPRTPVLPDRDVPIPLRSQVDAALLTRDAVVDLTHAVESLVGESERSSRRAEKLTVAIVVMSALLVLLTTLGLVLTALLLLHG